MGLSTPYNVLLSFDIRLWKYSENNIIAIVSSMMNIWTHFVMINVSYSVVYIAYHYIASTKKKDASNNKVWLFVYIIMHFYRCSTTSTSRSQQQGKLSKDYANILKNPENNGPLPINCTLTPRRGRIHDATHRITVSICLFCCTTS